MNKENQEFESILEKYKGLRKEDLNESNPEYSCVICGKLNCPYVGKPNLCCSEQTSVSVKDFVLRYDFPS